MTPQEKKRISYAKDRRNTYFENSKASRKGIPITKARGLRAERHEQDHLLAQAVRTLQQDQLVAIENQVRGTAPRDWRKSPDEPLGQVLARRRLRRATAQAKSTDLFLVKAQTLNISDLVDV